MLIGNSTPVNNFMGSSHKENQKSVSLETMKIVFINPPKIIALNMMHKYIKGSSSNICIIVPLYIMD